MHPFCIMTTHKRILFIAQEIFPYLPTETPIRLLNRQLPEYFQGHGFETRTFMPKFGDINERRNQLHEVIRLSGANLIIEDTDHPLILKVASIPNARIQFYFIDNDDYFARRKGIGDEEGEYKDNDERTIFFSRGVMDTVNKLRWTPDVIYCSGWMAALVPLYAKRAYNDSPFFQNAKIILTLDENEYTRPFGSTFANKLMVDGISLNDVRGIAGFPTGYEELMRLAIDYSDAFIITSKDVNGRLMNYVETQNKPILRIDNEPSEQIMALCDSLIDPTV